MALIPVLVTFAPLTVIASADVNSNFSNIQTAFNNTAVLTDVSKTITVTHIWNADQTIGGNLNWGTDATYDIGQFAAARPRNINASGYVSASSGMRSTGGTTYPSGAGIEVQFVTGVGNILSFDRTGGVYMPIKILGNPVSIFIGGTVNGIALDAAGSVTLNRSAKMTGTGNTLANAAAWRFGDNNSGSSRDWTISNGYNANGVDIGGLSFSAGSAANADPLNGAGSLVFRLTTSSVTVTGTAATGLFRIESVGGSGRQWDIRSNTGGTFSIVDVTGVQTRVTIDSSGTTTLSGQLVFSPDATYDIGNAGSLRPRSLFLSSGAVMGGSLSVGTTFTVGGLATFNDVGWFTSATTTPASGSGIEIDGGATPRVLAFNRTGTAYLNLNIEALAINLRPSASTVMSIATGAVTVTGTMDVSSTMSAFRYKGRGTAPSVTVNATGTGSGTGATATLTTGSTDTSGEVNITMGAGPVANGTLATFNFGTAMAGTNYFVLLTCYAGPGGAIVFYIPNAGKAAGSWQISSMTAPTGSLLYRVEYAVFGTG